MLCSTIAATMTILPVVHVNNAIYVVANLNGFQSFHGNHLEGPN